MKGRSGRPGPPCDARAVLREEIDHALALLAQPMTDESIHDFRQALKRARAALRLLRDAVSEPAYVRENVCLRDAARPLAKVRDAAVVLSLVDELLGSRKMRPYRPALLRVRRDVLKSHARLVADARAKRTAATMRRLLEQSMERTVRWRMPRDPLPLYASALRRAYRKSRDELETAAAEQSPTALHEWRKQVKYLAATLTLVAPVSPGAKARAIAERIAQRLGEHHDLALLTARLRRTSDERALASKLRRRQRKLQKRALALARRLDERCRALLGY